MSQTEDDTGKILCLYDGSNRFAPTSSQVVSVPPDRLFNALARKSSLRILFFTRRPEFFDFDDIFNKTSCLIASVTGYYSWQDLSECQDHFDIAIVCNTVMQEHLAHLIIKQRKLADLVIAWTFDNHHHEDWNRSMVKFSDIVLPGHSFAEGVFYGTTTLLGRSFPLTTGQWTRRTVVERTNLGARRDVLFGGYLAWKLGRRNEIVEAIAAIAPGSALKLIDPDDRSTYFDRPPSQRFDDWSAYKTHLALPLLGDLPCRFFDSLACGQIPLLPDECFDLDQVVPKATQDALPIVRFDPEDPSSILSAHREAVARFDEDGEVGILRRRDYVLNQHHIAERIEQIVTYLYSVARNGGKSTITCGDVEVKWMLDDPLAGDKTIRSRV